MFALTSKTHVLRAALLAVALLSVSPLADRSQARSQDFPADTCLSRREAIASVGKGSVLPLRQIRETAEAAARGEMINAELCIKGGQSVYVVTVLSTTGKVVYVTLNAATGQLMNTR